MFPFLTNAAIGMAGCSKQPCLRLLMGARHKDHRKTGSDSFPSLSRKNRQEHVQHLCLRVCYAVMQGMVMDPYTLGDHLMVVMCPSGRRGI